MVVYTMFVKLSKHPPREPRRTGLHPSLGPDSTVVVSFFCGDLSLGEDSRMRLI